MKRIAKRLAFAVIVFGGMCRTLVWRRPSAQVHPHALVASADHPSMDQRAGPLLTSRKQLRGSA